MEEAEAAVSACRQAARSAMCPCIAALLSASPSLCAPDQVEAADADAARPIRTHSPHPTASPPKLHHSTPALGAAPLGTPVQSPPHHPQPPATSSSTVTSRSLLFLPGCSRPPGRAAPLSRPCSHSAEARCSLVTDGVAV